MNKIQEHLNDCEFVMAMKKPLTDDQIKKLSLEYNIDQIIDTLDDMENFMKNGKTIDKCYTSTNLTLRKWLKIRGSQKESYTMFE